MTNSLMPSLGIEEHNMHKQLNNNFSPFTVHGVRDLNNYHVISELYFMSDHHAGIFSQGTRKGKIFFWGGGG